MWSFTIPHEFRQLLFRAKNSDHLGRSNKTCGGGVNQADLRDNINRRNIVEATRIGHGSDLLLGLLLYCCICEYVRENERKGMRSIGTLNVDAGSKCQRSTTISTGGGGGERKPGPIEHEDGLVDLNRKPYSLTFR